MRETGLPVVLRLDGRPVLLLGEGPAATAKRRLLERAGARIGDSPDARIAIVAIEDAAEAEEAAHGLKARGLLVNVVDRPDLCDFTLPAIVDRAPLVVAVATGGVSAGLAAAVRQRLEAWLPADLGQLAHGLGATRDRLRERYPDADARRRAIGAALAEGGVLDPLADGSADAVDRWLTSDAPPPESRLVALALASADPDELTLRAARLMARADRVFHRPDVPSAILDRARADAERIACTAPPADPGPGLSLDLEMAR